MLDGICNTSPIPTTTAPSSNENKAGETCLKKAKKATSDEGLTSPLQPQINSNLSNHLIFKLDKYQQNAVNLLTESDSDYFLYGDAGSGKSTVLKVVIENLKATGFNVIVLAPTGVAAQSIDGVTLHSCFNAPLHVLDKAYRLDPSATNQKVLDKADVIVIDEISMVRYDLFEAVIEHVLFYTSQTKPRPRIILTGDFPQLLPVVNKDDKQIYNELYYDHGKAEVNLFAFQSKYWNKFLPIELKQSHRQTDLKYYEILNSIRTRQNLQASLQELNKRVIKPNTVLPENCIYIAGNNLAVDKINTKSLNELKTPLETYPSKIVDNARPIYFNLKDDLQLKQGARIMVIRNNREMEYYNGLTGYYVGKSLADPESLLIKTDGGEIKTIKKEIWEQKKYCIQGSFIKMETIGSVEQYPLKPAWAFTVHKVQGLTLPSILLDKGQGFWLHGQAYVALSRVNSLENLYLKKPLTAQDIIIDRRVLKGGV